MEGKTMNDFSGGFDQIGLVGWIIYLAILIFYIIVMWKIFVKAGQPGWGAIIPIYNIYLLLQVAKRPGWWLLLFFIPIANIIVAIILQFDIAKNFGKGTGFGFGLLLLGFIFYPILAFGKAKYKKK
jgi:hypothetical protein